MISAQLINDDQEDSFTTSATSGLSAASSEGEG
jgi:hypothetical protein